MKNKNSMPIGLINNRMSLRQPQFESLQILDDIINNFDLNGDLKSLENNVHNKYPIFKEFERAFPSLTFALATGVGKTRLMGAFITYLYVNYGIKNYFVVAPNLTVYNKLIKDFGDLSYSKYLFKGLQQFAQSPPKIITGENYKDTLIGQTSSLSSSITINIFNIGKINAEVRGGSVPQIKRLSEYIGQSYFEYLSKLSDLVLLMDESHHYRADRGMQVLNELDPLLGLEFTATPQVETSKGAVKFRNVVYEYSLANAIRDGFVKTPAAATRKSFDPKKYSEDEVDRIKLNDGLVIHRNTKAALATYAANENKKLVKPFVLVVCKDTTHAAKVREFMQADEFFKGEYKDKIIELHSNQTGSEKDENVSKLLALEDEDNKIEIVIHVNMLKEGWDVTNLYTIIPLRTATSLTLREQTIGRGLRLPYGEITGNKTVDRLTIVAHDKFEEIIKAAADENSIIRKENIISIEDDEDYSKEKETVKGKTVFDRQLEENEQRITHVRSEEKKQALREENAVTRAVGEAIEEITTSIINVSVPIGQSAVNKNFVTIQDLNLPQVQALVIKKATIKLEKQGQISFESLNLTKKIEEALADTIEQKLKSTIEIPNIALVARGVGKIVYEDFDLELNYGFDYTAPSEAIFIEYLQDNRTETLENENTYLLADSPENLVINEILNLDKLIDFCENEELLYKVTISALEYIKKDKTDNDFNRILQCYKKEIAKQIYYQLKEHSHLTAPQYEIKVLQYASPILSEDYTKFKEDEISSYTKEMPEYLIKKTVFGGFSKACHDCYKFDSKPEQTFAIILERSNSVNKWLRPALGQFKINYGGGNQYQPDFVVETSSTIYIVEVKAYNRSSDDEVKLKARAAVKYCEQVNTVFTNSDFKQWKYLFITDREIERNNDFNDYILRNGWREE